LKIGTLAGEGKYSKYRADAAARSIDLCNTLQCDGTRWGNGMDSYSMSHRRAADATTGPGYDNPKLTGSRMEHVHRHTLQRVPAVCDPATLSARSAAR